LCTYQNRRYLFLRRVNISQEGKYFTGGKIFHRRAYILQEGIAQEGI